MTEVSARLRAARERAGLTIQDISASTKLAAATVLALERGEFTKLPGEFYTRAFLRTYARELHLSPDAIVAEFDAGREAAQVVPRDPSDGTRDHAIAAHAETASTARGGWRGPWPKTAAIAGNTGVVIVLLVVLLAVVGRSRSIDRTTAEPGAVGTSGNTAPAASTSMGTAPQDTPPEKLVIDIQAAASTWVTGAADGKRVLYRLLAPGERVTLEARDELAFRVGDAAAFTYAINGVAGKPIGEPGEVRDVQITRANYHSFRR